MASLTGARVASDLSLGPAIGPVSRRLFGQFSEHLHGIVAGGLAAELLVNRRFDLPGVVGRLGPVAAAWEPVTPAGVECRRGDTAAALEPGPECHHAQFVAFSDAHTGVPGGVLQGGAPLDAGVEYDVRVRCSVVGPIDSVTVALLRPDGTALGSVALEVPADAVLASAFLPDRREPVTLQGRVTSTESADPGVVAVTASPPAGSAATLLLYAVSLCAAGTVDNLHGGVADALRDLPASIVKWPGGCFADGYDWRLGVGPRDERHGQPDPAWGTWEEDDFGTDEFLRWCERTGTEPYLCVNHGTGTPELAAAWVEYCNGSADTVEGARRARNGHPEPYRVRHWAIGNEVFGFWERGHAAPDVYAANVRRFAEAMRAVDPTIRIAAQGDAGPYTEALLPLVGDLIDLLSVHHYSSPGLVDTDTAAYLAEGRAFESVLQRVVDTIRTTPDAGHVRIALDEWGWTPGDSATVAAYCATVLNATSRLAPYVEIGCHCCIANPMGVVVRRGETVQRTSMYGVFAMYAGLHRDVAHRVEGLPESVDGIAYADAAGVSVLLVNTSDDGVSVAVPFLDVASSRVHRGGATEPLAGDAVLAIAPLEVVGVAGSPRAD